MFQVGICFSCKVKLKEHLNVVDADSHVLRILQVVSRKARKEKNTTLLFVHYLLLAEFDQLHLIQIHSQGSFYLEGTDNPVNSCLEILQPAF